MNCWESLKCGREKGGKKVEELGVCPAYTLNAGQACWLVAGTFCQGQVQGTTAQKSSSCMSCKFYQSFGLQHRSEMRTKYSK